MSVDSIVALASEPPAVKVLAPLLARFGKPRGTWRGRVQFGDVVLQRTDDTVMMKKARKRSKLAFVATVQLWGPRDGIYAAAAALGELCGGGVLLTDEGIVLDRFDARPGRAMPKLAPIDVSLPAEVRRDFLSGQPRYALATRRETTYDLGAFFAEAKLDGRTTQLELIEAPTENFKAELRAHDVAKAKRLWRVHYKHWFVKEAKKPDWQAMLAATCGLARATSGLLYTIGPPQTQEPPAIDLRHDFAPARSTKPHR